MKKSNITVNRMENTIEVSKAFYNKACKYGTPEYEMLTEAAAQNPTFKIAFKENKKKTYTGLTLKRMKEYILTQPDSEKRLEEFKAIQLISEAKGAKYPLTKKWFLETFEDYKENEVKTNDAVLQKVKENKEEAANTLEAVA